MLKICKQCGSSKPINEYPFRDAKSNSRRAECKICWCNRNKHRYTKTRDYYIANAKRHKAISKSNNTRKLLMYLNENSCIDCGERNPLTLVFDHRKDKRNNISAMLHNGCSWSTILCEISKCDIRCSNCHRRKHAIDANCLKYRLLCGIDSPKDPKHSVVVRHLLDYLKLHPCVDCGESDPLVLTFDHVGDKDRGISTMIYNHGCCWDTIISEISKCQVCCANCHSKRTAVQQNWSMYRILCEENHAIQSS